MTMVDAFEYCRALAFDRNIDEKIVCSSSQVANNHIRCLADKK